MKRLIFIQWLNGIGYCTNAHNSSIKQEAQAEDLQKS